MALTALWLKNATKKNNEKEIVKADRDGLSARVRKGKVTFIFRGRIENGEGKPKTRINNLKIGTYPEMSLAEAREKAAQYNKMVQDGFDPRKKRKAQLEQNATEPSLDEIYQYWYKHKCSQSKKAHKEHKRSYEIHVQKSLGSALFADMKRRQFVNRLMEIKEKTPQIASRLLTDLREAIDFAIDHGLTEVQDNPIATVKTTTLGIVEKPRQGFLNGTQISLMYKPLHRDQGGAKNKIIFELMLFYGCRGAELRYTKRDWLDFDSMLWTVPAKYHKTGHISGQPLVRPILPEMRHLWEQLIEDSRHSEWLCYTMKNKAEKSPKQMSRGALQDVPQILREWALANVPELQENPGLLPHFSNHDLRRTGRTAWGLFGEWVICEKMLGHKIPGHADTYDVSTYAAKMRPVYSTWWKVLKRLEAGDQAVIKALDKQEPEQLTKALDDGNVIELATKRA